MSKQARNWFDKGGQAYAKGRPTYPPELAKWLADALPARQLAVDVGCGNGQFTRDLAQHFERVVGVDPSTSQLANARPTDNIEYLEAPAEDLPLPDACADIVTAAQAAHWFDLPRFYVQARRIARPHALLALVSYGVLEMDVKLQPRFKQFYDREIKHFWAPQRQIVDDGYQGIDFPFEEIPRPRLHITLDWTLQQFDDYLQTWSSLRRARELGQEHVFSDFLEDVTRQWGDPESLRTMYWPINLRIGRIHPAG